MTVSTTQQEALGALRYFNAAVSTIRLYPPAAPQVEKTIGRAYQGIKLYIEKNGEMSFGYKGNQPMLCAMPLFADTPEKIKDLPIFHHLRMVGLEHVLFDRTLTIPIFRQLLKVFTTSVEEIRKSGEVMSFVRSLGVAACFPSELKGPQKIQAELDREFHRQKTAVIEVPSQYLLFLFGKQKSPRIAKSLQKIFIHADKAMAVTAAAVAHILKEIQREKGLVVSPLFPLVISKVDQLVGHEQKRQVAVNTASFLAKGLREPALCVLLSQRFATMFGMEMYSALVHFISKGTFERIVELLRRQVGQLGGMATMKDTRHQLLVESYNRLMATNRGMQYLASEKVAPMIKGAEQQRQKSRVQTGLEALMRGDLKQLQSKEILLTLPVAVGKFVAENDKEKIALLVEYICKGSRKTEGNECRQLVQGLVLITEKLISLEKWDFTDELASSLLGWLLKSYQLDDVFRRCTACLQAIFMHGWQQGSGGSVDRIIETFFKIRIGSIDKPQDIIDHISKIQDEGIDRQLLLEQLKIYLEHVDESHLGKRLVYQGPLAGRILLQSLLDSENVDDRIVLIELLVNLDSMLPGLVLEHIGNPMPWYKKRNLLKLLGETGSEEHIESMRVLLNHENEKVRQEALTCIYKISGNNKKKYLLPMLSAAACPMKCQIVKALIPFSDEEVALELLRLLGDRRTFPADRANELLKNICKALGQSRSAKAVGPLQKFLQEKGRRKGGKIKDSVYRSAAKAIKKIESHQKELKEKKNRVKKLRKNAARQAAMIRTTAALKKKKASISNLPVVKEINMLLTEGKKERAKLLLMEAIARTAQKNQFSQAEKLRQFFIEIDPIALQEIIKAAEIIEEEKKRYVEQQQLHIWSRLRDSLTPEEFNQLYCAMDTISFVKGETLVEQGDSHPYLYFINEGKVKLYYREGDDDILITILESGNIFGTESFFNISVWTMGAACLTDSQLAVFSLSDLKSFEDDFPALASKLGDFCRKYESVTDFFTAKSRNRREHKRYGISGRAQIIMLDDEGMVTDQSNRGVFSDISLGGTTYFQRISRSDNARKILGKNVSVSVPLGEDGGKTVNVKGTIIAVRLQHAAESEYSVHVQFNVLLSGQVLRKILDTEKDRA